MRTLRLSCAASLLVAACVSSDVPRTKAQIAIRDAAAFEALPSLAFFPDRPLCADPVACLTPVRPYAVVSANGDVVLLTASGRGAEVGRVHAGTDSAVRVGREGSGPGEYRIPGLLGLSNSGDALVFDIVARRTLRFASDGTVLSTALVTLPPAPLGGFGFVDGELRILSTDVPKAAGDSLPVYVFALDSGASAARRRNAIELRQPAYGLMELRAPPQLFTPAAFFALREDGVVAFVDGAKMSLALFDAAGALVRQIGFDLEPRTPSESDIAEARALRLRGFPPGRMREAAERALTQSTQSRMPLVTGIVAMHDGELWLRGAPNARGTTVEWLVCAPNGEPLRRVTAPVDDAVLGKHGARYLVSRTDEEGSRYWWMTVR